MPGSAHHSGTAWQPLDLGAKLRTFVRADGGVTGTTNVTALADRSGNGNDWTAVAGPELKANGAGGQPYLEFSGTNEALQLAAGKTLASLITATACVVWAVFEAAAVDTNNASIQANDALIAHGLGYWGLHLRSAPNVLAYNFDGSEDVVSAAITTGSTRAFRARHAGGLLYGRLNGGAEASVASGATGLLTNTVYVGRAGTAAAYFAGKLYELGVCNADFAAGEAALLDAYIAARYGLVA